MSSASPAGGSEGPVRLAFINLATPAWPAGGHYQKNLFTALHNLEPSQRPEIVLLVDLSPSAVQSLPESLTPAALPEPTRSAAAMADRVLPFHLPLWPSWRRLVLHLPVPASFESLLSPRRSLEKVLHASQASAVFANGEFGPGLPLPLLAWIPDFQHLRLPELFTPARRRSRLERDRRAARFASRVVLSSRSALDDFREIAPFGVQKARILHFVAQVPPNVYDGDPGWVCQEYHLPERFFYLPNQFWKHKNHTLVVAALAELKSAYPAITVVSTGSPRSLTGSGHYATVADMVNKAGLESQMRFLGLVPHEHIFPLMRQSLAVLNPSLFEGWSTTVEEAKSLGKPLLLSDLPVHREQDPPAARYFDPHDPAALAELLSQAWADLTPGPSLALEDTARRLLPVRTRQFGEEFMRIAAEVL